MQNDRLGQIIKELRRHRFGASATGASGICRGLRIVVDNKICWCCQGDLHRIGEDRSERLDIVPAQSRVLVIRRPEYACRTC
jgi:zinc-finger binding domain of transposase IS66